MNSLVLNYFSNTGGFNQKRCAFLLHLPRIKFTEKCPKPHIWTLYPPRGLIKVLTSKALICKCITLKTRLNFTLQATCFHAWWKLGTFSSPSWKGVAEFEDEILLIWLPCGARWPSSRPSCRGRVPCGLGGKGKRSGERRVAPLTLRQLWSLITHSLKIKRLGDDLCLTLHPLS